MRNFNSEFALKFAISISFNVTFMALDIVYPCSTSYYIDQEFKTA